MSRLSPIAKQQTRRQASRGNNVDELRLAAMDVGSNSIHMIIAQVDASGGITVLWRAKEMVGLGRTSFPAHRLSNESMERAYLTLRRFAAETQRWQCEHVVAVATSAVREAENGGQFIDRVRRELKIHVRVVSAKEEARLIYLGVRHAINLGSRPQLIVDIGGGSVEFIVADADKPLLLESRKLGAARMTARFIKSDPIEAKELKALQTHYDAELGPIMDQALQLKPARIIGTSGAVENLTVMCAGQSSTEGEPAILKRSALEKLLDVLIESRSKDRASLRGLDDKRRDQILPSAILLNEVFRRLEMDQLELCRSALREGILVDYLAKHRPELEIRRNVPNPRRRAILDLGRRCHWHQAHAEQVGAVCVRLFDQLRSLHGLGWEERELIEYGALLHDIGSLIGRSKHHKHSMYLILHGDLQPFSKDEIRTIACIARYHRKESPSKSDQLYAGLPKRLRKTIRIGAALLRIADGLDRTNCSVVQDVATRMRPDKVEILVDARGDAELELWTATERSKLFEKVFRRPLKLLPLQ